MTDDDILKSWDTGKDTLDIARFFNVPESEVTRRLVVILHERRIRSRRGWSRASRRLIPYAGRE